MKYRHEAVVQGRGSFPIDMLRYDQCWPVGGEDSVEIERSLHHERGPFTVNVRADSPAKEHWTPDRWRSFGWTVVNTHTERRK